MLDCLQSAFCFKVRQEPIRLVLISSSAIANHDVVITIRDGDETRKDGLLSLFSKQNLRQPRNRVTEWSNAQLLTDHWLVCREIASSTNSHASQPTVACVAGVEREGGRELGHETTPEGGGRRGTFLSFLPRAPHTLSRAPKFPLPLPLSTPTTQAKPTANNSEPSSYLSNKTFKDILITEWNCWKFLKGNEFKAILPDLKKCNFFSCLCLFINRFRFLGFNWLIKLPFQLGCPHTEQKSQQSLMFSSRAYALISRGLIRNSRA